LRLNIIRVFDAGMISYFALMLLFAGSQQTSVTEADFRTAAERCGVDLRTYWEGGRRPAAAFSSKTGSLMIAKNSPEEPQKCLAAWGQQAGLQVVYSNF
jgi:hypothetical protein